MSCTVDARLAVQQAADQLGSLPAVVAIDVVAPTKGQTDRWAVEAVVQCPGGVPASVHREIAIAGLSTRPQPTRGDTYRIVATA